MGVAALDTGPTEPNPPDLRVANNPGEPPRLQSAVQDGDSVTEAKFMIEQKIAELEESIRAARAYIEENVRLGVPEIFDAHPLWAIEQARRSIATLQRIDQKSVNGPSSLLEKYDQVGRPTGELI